MGWHAKPTGSYGYNSDEGRDNIAEINKFFNGRGYTLESQAGIIGNVIGESGLNPWRWQGDEYDLTGGYGLFQYTPASEYINGCTNISNYSPNLSVTSITPNANPRDGLAQLTVFADNSLGKWVPTCWRPYWDTETYVDLYQVRNRILNVYGDGSGLSMKQFMGINNVYDSTFAFLACFEGPAVPNMGARYEFASAVYQYLTGDMPDEPDTPTKKKKKMPLWMYLYYN